MTALQAGISYWLSVAARAVQTFPGFIGNNWIGVLLPFALLLPGAPEVVRKFTSQTSTMAWSGKLFYAGQLLMGTAWKHLAAVLGVFWIMNFLTVGFGDYNSLIEGRRQSKEQLDNANSQLASSVVTCQLKTNEITNHYDSEQAKSRTLEKQNRDQQTLIAGCQSEALKRLIPAPFDITPLKYESTTVGNPPKTTVRYLLLANTTRPSVRIGMSCMGPVLGISASIPRIDGFQSAAIVKYGIQFWQIDTTQWNPSYPLPILLTNSNGEPTCVFSHN